MGKIMKPGRIVIMLSGRYPRRVTRRMPKKKQKKMLKMKPFVKVTNYTHLLPTRYLLDCKFDTKKVNKDVLKDKALKRKAREEVRTKFHDKLITGKNQWFFTKFRF